MAKGKSKRSGAKSAAQAPDASSLLAPQFEAKHTNAALSHFNNAVNDYSKGDWEGSIGKAGKFVEALLKALGVHCNVPFEEGRKFKADKLMNDLGQTPQGSFDDTLRLLIPRACRVIYDIASNRGARHDPHEINPNSMDANVVMPLASWLLAEAIRYAQKGAVDPSGAEQLVESLTERRYPVVEKIEGRAYLHAVKKSARDVALVVLADQHPRRMTFDDLLASVERNGFTKDNAKKAIQRIENVVDFDDSGGMRLLTTGLGEAEEIMRSAKRPV